MFYTKLGTLIICIGLALPMGMAMDEKSHAPAAASGTVTVLKAKMGMRDLWLEHIFWVRNNVFATSTGNADQIKVTTDEIVANAKAIAGSIAPFYGQGASDKLFGLLAGHWGAISDYNKATFEKSSAGKAKARTALEKNARAISVFLSGANPHYPQDVLFGALAAHGAHHILQIEAVFKGDYAKEAKDWAAMRGHMLVIADVLIDGLAQQFPEKF